MGYADPGAWPPVAGTLRTSSAGPISLVEVLAPHDGPALILPAVETDGSYYPSDIALADTLPEQIALLDREGTIVTVNKAWRETARPHAICGLGEGDSYRQACLDRAGNGDADALAIARALRLIGGRALDCFDHLDRGDCSSTGRIYRVRLNLLPVGSHCWATLARYDVTELMALRRQKRRLSAMLLDAEAEERRRIARDLHDSTAQELVALQLSLAQLKRAESPAAEDAISDIGDALGRLQREIRALSYLFHAPAIEHGDICAALEKMTLGFGQRAGLDITLLVEPVNDIEPKVGYALYRLAQEALANIHRHAKATEVELRLLKTDRSIHFMVRDNGVGHSRRADDPEPVGVGLASMRERISEIGGWLTVRYGRSGTSVIASVPMTEADSIEA